tara:strand:+ start:1077 stop:1316 length:240 start_codon:yes stop_codon:yes gene_type:complete
MRETREFKWSEVKHLKKRELFHLTVESAITGWDTIDQQKQYHAEERARCAADKVSGWGARPHICYECESIFKKLDKKEN